MNFDGESDVPIFKRAPQCNGIYYSGYMRDEFGDLGLSYVRNSLDSRLKTLYSRVRSIQNAGLYDYSITDSYDDAVVMMQYLNSDQATYEIIALRSKSMQEVLGVKEYPGAAEFLGYDVNGDGYSLVLYSLFEKSKYFSDEVNEMNNNGLLSTKESAGKLIEKYLKVQHECGLEPIDARKVEPILVYRVEQ